MTSRSVVDNASDIRRPRSDVCVIDARKSNVSDKIRELIAARALVWFYSKYNMKRRYRNTYLGWLWIPLRFVLGVGVKILIFGGLLHAPSGGIPYPLFFLLGYGVFEMFSVATYWATRCIDMNRRFLKRLYVPRLVFLVAAMAPGILDLLVVAGALLLSLSGYLLADHTFYLRLGEHTWLLPAGLTLLLLLAMSIGTWTGVLGAERRDCRFFVRIVLNFVGYVTPIIYPLSAVPRSLQPVAELNPITAPIEMVREALFNSGDIRTTSVIATLVTILIVGGAGLRFFVRAEQRMANAL